jgi:glycine dehydrogenase subunit 1
MTIRTSMLGKSGFIETGKQCLAKATYLRDAITGLSGYSSAFGAAPFFNEFTVRVRGGSAASVCAKLEGQGIIAGLDLGPVDPAQKDLLLIAVTEKHTRPELDRFVQALSSV